MAKWLSTKEYEKLTDEEVKEELENLLRNCNDEGEFDKECQHRFGKPPIAITWTHSIRIVTIGIQGREKSIDASVSIL